MLWAASLAAQDLTTYLHSLPHSIEIFVELEEQGPKVRALRVTSPGVRKADALNCRADHHVGFGVLANFLAF